jgi:hypothetical protein
MPKEIEDDVIDAETLVDGDDVEVDLDELSDDDLLDDDALVDEALDDDDDLLADDEIDDDAEVVVSDVVLIADGDDQGTRSSGPATAVEGDESAADEDDDDLLDDDDVEASLDVILKERLVVEDEDEDEDDEPADAEDRGDGSLRVLPKQPGEFVCRSCFLVKSETQLADEARMLCRDCV